MKKKLSLYEHKASTREYLVALACYPNFTKLLNPTDKPYDKLLKWLLENETFLVDENQMLLSIKELSQKLGIDTSKITKYLKMIYEDILELNFNKPHLFKKEGQMLCRLHFKYLGSYYGFNIGLDFIPRCEDRISFYFMNPKIGNGTSFHVYNIHHYLDFMGHSINISLSSEYPNAYFKLLKDKAYLQREISFKELIDIETSDELTDTLLKWYRNL